MFKKLIIIGALLASANVAHAGVMDDLQRLLLDAAASARHATRQCNKPRFDAVVLTRTGSPFFNVLFKALRHRDDTAKQVQQMVRAINHTRQQLVHASGAQAYKLKKILHRQQKKLRRLQRQERLYFSFARKVVTHQTSLIYDFKTVCGKA